MNKKVIVVLGSLILLLVLFSASYVMLNNNLEKNESDIQDELEDNVYNDDSNEPIPDTIKFKEIKMNSDKITESFDITMNGKTKSFEIDYTYKENEDFAEIIGKSSNLILYYDSYEKDTETEEDFTSFKENYFTENYLKNKFTEKNFKFIKSEDNYTYLAVVVKSFQYTSGYSNYLYILDGKFENVKGDTKFSECDTTNAFTMRNDAVEFITSEDVGNKGYKDSLGVCSKNENSNGCHLYTQIKDNKIYYLVPKNITADNEENKGTIEERVYTIKDNKLEYTVNASYMITEVIGQAC